MSSDNRFVKLDQAIRKYIRSEKVQREIEEMQQELLEKVAMTFLRQHAKVQSTFRVRGTITPPGGVEVAFSNLLIDSVTAVITDEFKK